MAHVTQKELGVLQELLRLEASLYEKFGLFAEIASEDATKKLCRQLEDRSREHFQATLDSLSPGADSHLH